MTRDKPKPVVVTGGLLEHKLLNAALVANDVAGFRSVAADGPDSAVRVGQQRRLEENAPVLVVLDANTKDEDEAHSRSEELTEFLRLGRATSPAWVVCAIPAVASILFRRPAWLRRRSARLDETLVKIGRDAPAAVLEEVFGRDWREVLVQHMAASDRSTLACLASDPVVADVADFVARPDRFEPAHLAAPRLGFGT